MKLRKASVNIKKKELREWIKDKKNNKMFVLMCYASVSFKLQRNGAHNICLKLSKENNSLYHRLNTAEDIICGWADDLMKLIGDCYPDFKEKFFIDIPTKEAEEIICSELCILNI